MSLTIFFSFFLTLCSWLIFSIKSNVTSFMWFQRGKWPVLLGVSACRECTPEMLLPVAAGYRSEGLDPPVCAGAGPHLCHDRLHELPEELCTNSQDSDLTEKRTQITFISSSQVGKDMNYIWSYKSNRIACPLMFNLHIVCMLRLCYLILTFIWKNTCLFHSALNNI